MASDKNRSPYIETAHVLFIDIVDYSRLPLREQPRRVAELQEIVRGTAGFSGAEGSGDLLRLPTGDGMALVFFRDPVAPLQCALEIAGKMRDRPELKLRMGLHSGPVYRLEDINTNANVAGTGITLAQRVMDCGDAGHILLSSAVAELVGQAGEWPLHDLGECEVKHGLRLHLFNLATDALGNPAVPAKLRSARPWTLGTSEAENAARGTETTVQQRANKIALLYKRSAEPDEELLRFLETQLAARGYDVFVDRHLAVGVEWAREIERQIRTSDAVIPLLSAASIGSEMLAHEMELAQDAQQQQGRPRILPVRVGYLGPFPPALAAILDPLQSALWSGIEENERLLTELIQSLDTPTDGAPVVPRAKLEPVGGAVPLDSRFYVVRDTDDDFRAAIARRDSIVLVKGARQVGKTSLLARGLQQAREAGAKVVLTDFQKLNAAHLESAEALFLTLAEWIADQLDLEVFPEEVWQARRGPSVNFERYLRREVLGKVSVPVVWGLDEVDRLFSCDFGSEVFGLFRAWHNERALDPTGPWSRLTLAIAYATEAHLFITDMNQSPFNVGTRLALEDFSFEQVADLNRRHGSPLRDEAQLARFYRLLGGHPYLVRRALLEMATHGAGIAEFEAQAARDEWIYGDHLRRLLVALSRDPELCEVVRGVLRGRPCATPESFYRLRTAGLVTGDSTRDVHLRCQLYATYLRRHLL